ncbi:MAG: hypothetical protein Q4D19_01485 [Lautropia sp.]|nr:hypothetical protein [Lautropia sp.]
MKVIPTPEYRLLPGALLPKRWLAGMPLEEALPAIHAALAGRQLLITEVPLPADAGDASAGSGWAHDVWLAQQPGMARHALSVGSMAALRRLARLADAGTPAAPGWLLQPVTFRLTTDRMLLDPGPGQVLDATLADRLVHLIRPLLAESGYAIRLLSPDCWLLERMPGHPDWQLQCTPIEVLSDRHVDDHLPQGPDARAFRRLFNEIQMIWHQLGQQGEADLPVNGVWLTGPIDPQVLQAWSDLHDLGLRIDEDLLSHRTDLDPTGWLASLPVLDAWYQAAPSQFALLLAGERRLRWLHAPGALPASLQPVGARPQPVSALPDGSWWQRLRARFPGQLAASARSSSSPADGRPSPLQRVFSEDD